MAHEIYKNKKVFLTGHTGFKGSWLALWLQELGAEVAGYSLAPEQLSHFNLLDLKMKNYFNNINDQVTLEKAMMDFKPDIVFHLAAQPLVRDSYDDPINTYETNVVGSLKVYMAALKANVGAIVSITTDKVYENKEWLWGYRENDQLGGHDPYSASKACMELMTSSFRKSFLADHKMLIATARAGNVIGGGDWAKDRLIPDLVKNANENKKTPIRNPNSVRPWQHVLEPLHGYLMLGEKLLKNDKTYSESFNFGPHMTHNLSVGEVCKIAGEHWDKITIQITEEPKNSNKHEAELLKLDIEKAVTYLSWNPTFTANESIELTTNWYKAFYLQKTVSTKDDLKKMIAKIKV